MNKTTAGIAMVLLSLTSGCFAASTEAPYKRGRDFDPANMEHLLYNYNKASDEQKSISLSNIETLETLNTNRKWTSLAKTAHGLLWSYPMPQALVYLGNAYLGTSVDGKTRRELIDNKKMNFTTAKSYYSAALKFSVKVNMPMPQLEQQARINVACIEEYIESEKFTNPEKCRYIAKTLADNKI